MTVLTYAVVTPARNEEQNLPRLAAALAAQSRRPIAWVVIDDGSSDGTASVLAELASRIRWLYFFAREDHEGGLAAGRREGRDLLAFCDGVAALAVAPDVVIKMDADIDFDDTYCDQLIARFEADPKLGIASGTCLEQEAGGAWVRRTKADSTVWGASRAYRWECVIDLLELEPCMGWDGLDELRVQLRGMRTETFIDLPFRHNRPEGGRELTSLHQGAALGRASWYMGYRPSYLALRALYRARTQPAAIAMLWGYAAAALRRRPRYDERAVVALLRERQRLRVTLRRGAPSS